MRFAAARTSVVRSTPVTVPEVSDPKTTGQLRADYDALTADHAESRTALGTLRQHPMVRLFGPRRTIPTGIAHGTVTVLCERPGEARPRSVEVTRE